MGNKAWNHKWYGFFSSQGEIANEVLPNIDDYMDKNWSIPDLTEVLQYLKAENFSIVIHPLNPTKCHLCDKYEGNPASYFYDGTWFWPERLAHVVESHNVFLPDEFLSHIRNSGYNTNIKPSFTNYNYLPWPQISKKLVDKINASK